MKQKELSAEAYLGLLYRGQGKKWTVHNQGLFFRNYSEDVMSIDEESQNVTLSRDGWLRYCPQELISPVDEIQNIKKSTGKKKMSVAAIDEMIRKRIRILSESLVPFDTFAFRMRLQLDDKLQEILDGKVNYILKRYYDFDMEAETDENIRKAAMLLPYLPRIRGNVNFVVNLMQTLTHRKIECRYTTYGEIDNTRCSTRKVFFDVVLDGLDEKRYKEEMDRMTPLFTFLQDRFLPLDLMSSLGIKGENSELCILDYNYSL